MRKNFLTLVAAALAMEGSSRHKMKVTFGDMIVNASGSAGGSTYSRNKGGAYRKNKAIPLQPRSDKQIAVRQNLGTLAAAWRSLTQTQIAAWNAAAKNVNIVDSLGRTSQPTGLNYFVSLNAALLNWIFWATANNDITDIPAASFAPVINDPPASFSPNNFSFYDFEISGSPVDFGLQFNSDYAGTGFIDFAIYGLPPVSAGISNPGNNFVLIGFLKLASGITTTDPKTLYERAFGVPGDLTKVFLKAQQIDISTGQSSLFASVNAVVNG